MTALHCGYATSRRGLELLLDLLPAQWQQQAVLSGACERLRGFSSASSLLRTLLLHVGNGYSLRETVVKAKAAGIAAALLGELADHTSIGFVYRVCAFMPLLGLLTVFLPDIEGAMRRDAKMRTA